MSFFTQDYRDFFTELTANNHREWFHANKKRYENAVKKPFKAFTEEMIKRCSKEDSGLQIEAKNCIFRINRDIRFSKDKTPYKTSMSAIVSRGGRKDMSTPGMYFEIKADEARLYGGLYRLEKENLYNVRSWIMENNDEFEKIINASGFKKAFGSIHGEKNKRLPKEFTEAAEKQPLLFNKGFYYFSILDPKFITNGKLADKFMELHTVAMPLQSFLKNAIGA